MTMMHDMTDLITETVMINPIWCDTTEISYKHAAESKKELLC
jgi:hypothetical protein